ncbi:MAG: hypothetical protein HYZ40_05910 [Rhodospirillales bacterium]|nr:hypothetical protein [Rhodospirillales bacterium]
MTLEKPRITAKIAGRALHPLLRPFAIGYFLAVCACDLIYSQASVFARSGAPEFASITEWLLIAGLATAGLAAVVALIDLLGERRFRSLPDARMFQPQQTPMGDWRAPAFGGMIVPGGPRP